MLWTDEPDQATVFDDATAAQFRAELRRLGDALVAYRRFEPGPITCGLCGSDFGSVAAGS